MGSVSYLIPCAICGCNTSSPSERCAKCWSLEEHLEEYLKHKAGRDNVADILLRMDVDQL